MVGGVVEEQDSVMPPFGVLLLQFEAEADDEEPHRLGVVEAVVDGEVDLTRAQCLY